MSYDDTLDDNLAFDAPAPEVDRTALSIRRSIASVETSLTEFDKITAGLEALREQHPIDLVFDVSTTKGMAEAVAHRAAWRDPRITVEKYRKAAKAPVLTLGKDIDARAAWLTEQLLLGETPVHEQIKAEEARKAQEKADREAKEFGRIVAMQEAIAEIAMTAMVAGKPSSEIAARLDAMKATQLDPLVYQEMMPQAQEARVAAIAKMEQGLKAAQWDEAEAARKAQEAETLRIQREAEDAERARVSAEQAAEAKRLQDARDMIARAEKEAADKIAAERAQFERERAEFVAAQEKAAKELAARDSQQVLKAEAPAPDATDRDAPVNTSPSVGSMGAGQPADAGAIPEVGTLNAGHICKRLGFVLTVDFIVTDLGIPPTTTEKRATLWTERQFRAICLALVEHIAKVRSEAA